MKIQITPLAFQTALSVVDRFATGGTYRLPILRNVALIAEGETLTLIADDGVTRAETVVSAEIEEPGATTLPAASLGDFLDICVPTEMLTLVVNTTDRANLSCGRASAKLTGLPASDFPAGAPADDTAWLVIPVSKFKAAISCVAHAAATTDSRPMLAAVNITSGNNTIDGTVTFQAFDGYRAVRWESTVAPIPETYAANVPVGPLREIAKALTGDDPVEIRYTPGGLVRIVAGRATWTIKTIDGAYGDLRRMLVEHYEIVVACDRDRFRSALRFARSYDRNGDKDPTARALLDIRPGVLTVIAEDATSDHGGEVGLEAEVQDSRMAGRVCLNATYVQQAIDAIDAERIVLEVPPRGADIVKPVAIRADGPRNGHVQLVAPLVDRRTEFADARHAAAGGTGR